ncbi:unnamed protein product [Protopolystoma xenopodis]|uniref:Uncharacterized protein n=1 Tax=Protopolystoma xenopodis TaxID=117903 RepID=A0A448X1G2_9PLAT|nr:unnamed protein product [Protopolystoma xenopodis]
MQIDDRISVPEFPNISEHSGECLPNLAIALNLRSNLDRLHENSHSNCHCLTGLWRPGSGISSGFVPGIFGISSPGSRSCYQLSDAPHNLQASLASEESLVQNGSLFFAPSQASLVSDRVLETASTGALVSAWPLDASAFRQSLDLGGGTNGHPNQRTSGLRGSASGLYYPGIRTSPLAPMQMPWLPVVSHFTGNQQFRGMTQVLWPTVTTTVQQPLALGGHVFRYLPHSGSQQHYFQSQWELRRSGSGHRRLRRQKAAAARAFQQCKLNNQPRCAQLDALPIGQSKSGVSCRMTIGQTSSVNATNGEVLTAAGSDSTGFSSLLDEIPLLTPTRSDFRPASVHLMSFQRNDGSGANFSSHLIQRPSPDVRTLDDRNIQISGTLLVSYTW